MNTRCAPVAAPVALALLLTPALHAAPVTRTTALAPGTGNRVTIQIPFAGQRKFSQVPVTLP